MAWIWEGTMNALMAGIEPEIKIGDASETGTAMGSPQFEDGSGTNATTDSYPLDGAPESGTEFGSSVPTFSVKLNPFRILLKALRIPRIGLIDLTIEAHKKYIVRWTSWIYRMLPIPIFGLNSKKTGLNLLSDLPVEMEYRDSVLCGHCGDHTDVLVSVPNHPSNKNIGSLCLDSFRARFNDYLQDDARIYPVDNPVSKPPHIFEGDLTSNVTLSRF
jgi:hypothetical protein